MFRQKTHLFNGDSREYEYNLMPDTCPVCHRSISPKNTGYWYRTDLGKESLNLSYGVFICPSEKCRSLFIFQYKEETPNSVQFLYESTFPILPKSRTFSNVILDISNQFQDIYNQAFAAEQLNLNHICGIGYRKAFEFLIKDYIIKKNPKEANSIKKKFLSTCINEYIHNDALKSISHRASWLGNDETHYLRKWLDKDIGALKKSIDLSVSWIETESYTQQMIDEMPEEVPSQNKSK